ncbi:hypothetical protein OH76DRAFT_1409102 [Lentinus brumalis]|uniref:Uncharacterized protein n=1 Tax=Lentinus brumalis TaxID=2498619 RepID=A0A371CVS1_9APHY|nr:hypothetical protein OH76DRAFT_1409102 [Polyporus brumalis]
MSLTTSPHRPGAIALCFALSIIRDAAHRLHPPLKGDLMQTRGVFSTMDDVDKPVLLYTPEMNRLWDVLWQDVNILHIQRVSRICYTLLTSWHMTARRESLSAAQAPPFAAMCRASSGRVVLTSVAYSHNPSATTIWQDMQMYYRPA